MFNNELYEIISQDKTLMMGFQGIRSADQLPETLQCDQSLIFNASDSDEIGTHWLCLYQNSDTELEMFDSCGNPPSFYNLQNKLPYSRTFTYNKRKLRNILECLWRLLHAVFILQIAWLSNKQDCE